jgi:hypothetical protein
MATPSDESADQHRPRPAPRTETNRSGHAAPQPGQLASTTTGAIVAAAKVGRLLGRTGWRLARQLPVVTAVETAVGSAAQRLGSVAAEELLRMLDIPEQAVRVGNPEERRVLMLVENDGADPEPLRSAMTELLQRSSASTSEEGKDYLFGTIISQLVPDEARILAALAGGRRFAVIDVVARQVGRSRSRTVLTNASTVGAAAHVALADNVPTYLTRLQSFGLLEFGAAVDGLDAQFAALEDDPAVRAARTGADGKFGSARVVRKSVLLSQLGREFWTAAAPRPEDLDRLSG